MKEEAMTNKQKIIDFLATAPAQERYIFNMARKLEINRNSVEYNLLRLETEGKVERIGPPPDFQPRGGMPVFYRLVD